MELVLILLVISWIVFNYIHELGHLVAARMVGIGVDRMFYGVGPIAHRTTSASGTENLFGVLPVASVHFNKASYESATAWRRLFASSAGPLANFGCTFLLLAAAYLMSPIAPGAFLDVVDDKGVAATAGLQDGDRIVGVDGADTETWGDVGIALLGRAGDTGTIDLTVAREGDLIDYAFEIEEWQSDVAWIDMYEYFGITRKNVDAEVSGNPFVGIFSAFVKTVEIGWSTAIGGFKMVFGSISVMNFGGGMQLTQLGLESSNLDVAAVLMLLGLFSLGFGVINLLPGPVVDGLAMIYAAFETIVRRPIPEVASKWLFVVGSILAFGPIPLCILHDVMRFT